MLTCTPGGIDVCYDGPATTKDIGSCKSGQAMCQPDGMSHSACMGAVKPTFDDCFSAVDEDCDGKTPACTGSTVNAVAPSPTTGDDAVFAVASDAADNIYFGGSADSIAKASYYLASGGAYITKRDKAGMAGWTKSFPVMGGSGFSVVRGIAVDATGNVFIVGEFQGQIAANGLSLTSSTAESDVFVIKLDSNGTPKWGRPYGKDGNQLGTSIAADAAGNVFICGYMNGSIDFGATAGGIETSKGSYDAFVVKLDPVAGDPLWGKRYGDGGDQRAWHLATSPDGGVVVTGQYTGDMDFGKGWLGNAGGLDDIFLAKLAGGDGAGLWSKHFGDWNDQEGFGVAVDSQNNIVMVGRAKGTTSFGGADLNAVGFADAFVAHLAPDGAHQWSSLFGDPGSNDQSANGVTFDGADNVLVTGRFQGSMTINGTTLTEASGSTSLVSDVFVAKLKGVDGLSGWARTFGDKNDQVAWAIASDPLGNVIVGGSFNGNIDFGPPAALSLMSKMNDFDGFWAKLAP